MLNNTSFNSPVATDSPEGGPGGNRIVPTPATPNEWPKMLIAIAIVSGGIWVISTFNEEASLWIAGVLLLAMVTYYETHGNKQFSTGIQNLLGSIR